MITRIPGIALILLANMILLAHNAIPHHHHPHQVCLVSSHCNSGEGAHSHESEMPAHEHDGANETEPCSLKQVIALPPGQLRSDSWGSDLPSFNDTEFDIFNSGKEKTACKIIATGQVILFPFFHFSNFLLYHINCCGLRAPPTV
jgi:hypothetical protein